MRTPEYVWLFVEGDKVVAGQMPNGEPSVYAVPVGQPVKDALEQMARDEWQPLGDKETDASGNYRIRLVRENPPE
jgi:hypothetical protein